MASSLPTYRFSGPLPFSVAGPEAPNTITNRAFCQVILAAGRRCRQHSAWEVLLDSFDEVHSLEICVPHKRMLENVG